MIITKELLSKAIEVVGGDRQKEYGDKVDNHNNIAKLWSAYLDVKIEAHDVSVMMILLKVARTKIGTRTKDTYVDMAGYSAIAGEIEFRGKDVEYQFCELVEKEEPKFKPLSDRASEEEKMAYYTDIGARRILAMLEKANDKNPEGPCISEEHWGLLPTTLRYQISNDIMGIEQESRENFPL